MIYFRLRDLLRNENYFPTFKSFLFRGKSISILVHHILRFTFYTSAKYARLPHFWNAYKWSHYVAPCRTFFVFAFLYQDTYFYIWSILFRPKVRSYEKTYCLQNLGWEKYSFYISYRAFIKNSRQNRLDINRNTRAFTHLVLKISVIVMDLGNRKRIRS